MEHKEEYEQLCQADIDGTLQRYGPFERSADYWLTLVHRLGYGCALSDKQIVRMARNHAIFDLLRTRTTSSSSIETLRRLRETK